MAFDKITDADLLGKGVVGQPDVPGLSALEMQNKVEEVVRAVVIPKVNGLIDDIVTELATKEELAALVIEAGAVTSVFGRAGNVTPQAGDYTAEMVGAAPAQHKNQHKTGGADALTPSDIGAANESHDHGAITSDGKVGTANGKVLMTGLGGAVTAVDKADSGLALPPTTFGGTEETPELTLEDNAVYLYDGVKNLTVTVGDMLGECEGEIKFAAGSYTPTVTCSGFDFVSENFTEAAAGETWEFSCWRKRILWKKVSVDV